MELYRNAWNFAAELEIPPCCLEIYRAAKSCRFALPGRAMILSCCGYLKFRLFLKFRFADRSSKFKKRKQTSCKIRLRLKISVAL
ncbi:hypothetical protein [uncultured Campylobacter sp.]|uniref:hypothetical protein n=1 Tax=uncultured Campylobacter sp. TaxID=218934 RepID=UPI002639101B|nr:hypothetical protein [uncultured Campylobacter sp.]